MRRFSIELENMLKDMDFYHLQGNLKKQLLDTGLDANKQVVNKAAEYLGNKIADAILPKSLATRANSNDDDIEKQEPIEEMIIPPEKKKGNIKQIEKSIIKMEPYKISKLLNNPTVSKFVTKNWVDVNDLSNGQYSVNKNMSFKTSMLRSDLCDYSDAYIVAKGTIDLLAAAANKNDKAENDVAFKSNAPFRLYILKINSTLIDNEQDLDVVMPMYNLLKYSQSYSMTSGNIWNYYRDKIDDVDDNASDGNSFQYKTKIHQKHLIMKEIQINHQYSNILVVFGDLLICY